MSDAQIAKIDALVAKINNFSGISLVTKLAMERGCVLFYLDNFELMQKDVQLIVGDETFDNASERS